MQSNTPFLFYQYFGKIPGLLGATHFDQNAIYGGKV